MAIRIALVGPLLRTGVHVLRIVGDGEASKSSWSHVWIGELVEGGVGWGFHEGDRNQGRGSLLALVRVFGCGNFV